MAKLIDFLKGKLIFDGNVDATMQQAEAMR